MKFRDHEYKWSYSFDLTRHQWSLRGPRGGISFHVSRWEGPDGQEKHAKFGGPSCGLEFHRAFDPTGGEEAPSHAQCWLLKCACWHDGTSLYASETLWPIISSMMPDHATIFKVLEGEYDSHFSRLFRADDGGDA